MWRRTFTTERCYYVTGVPAITLARGALGWTLTARVHSPDGLKSAAWPLRALGRFARHRTDSGYRDFVGYIRYESDERPTLLFVGDSGLEFEPDPLAEYGHDADQLSLDEDVIRDVKAWLSPIRAQHADIRSEAIELLQLCPAPAGSLSSSAMFNALLLEHDDDALFAVYRRVGEDAFNAATSAVLDALIPKREETAFAERVRMRNIHRAAIEPRLARFRSLSST